MKTNSIAFSKKANGMDQGKSFTQIRTLIKANGKMMNLMALESSTLAGASLTMAINIMTWLTAKDLSIMTQGFSWAKVSSLITGWNSKVIYNEHNL